MGRVSDMAPHTRTQPPPHPVPPSLYRLTRLLLPHYAPTTGKASAPQTLEDLVSLVVNQPAAAAALLTHTPALATMPTVVKLLRLLLLTTLHGGVGGVVGAQAADLLACLDEADEPPAREAPLPPAALTALCGAMAALIDAAGPQLAAHADARRSLHKAFTSEAIESLNTAALGVPSAQVTGCHHHHHHLLLHHHLHLTSSHIPSAARPPAGPRVASR